MARKRRYDEFMESMKSLLETGKHSDFTITCRGDTYNVHKSIVCSQCDFFDGVSRFGKQSQESAIDLPDEEPEIVKYMIQYMYELDYRIPSDDSARPWWIRVVSDEDTFSELGEERCRKLRHYDGQMWRLSASFLEEILIACPTIDDNTEVIELYRNNEVHARAIKRMDDIWNSLTREEKLNLPAPQGARDLGIHAKVYAIADKYKVKGLRETALEKFKYSLERSHTCGFFFEAVDFVYSNTPDSNITLRDLIAQRLYHDKKKYGLYRRLDESLRTVPDLAYRILRHEYSNYRDWSTERTRTGRSSTREPTPDI